MTDNSKSERSNFAGIFITLLPTIIGVLVMAGGWIASTAANKAMVTALDQRVTRIEQSGYITRQEHDAADKIREDVLNEMRLNIREIRNDIKDHMTATRTR